MQKNSFNKTFFPFERDVYNSGDMKLKQMINSKGLRGQEKIRANTKGDAYSYISVDRVLHALYTHRKLILEFKVQPGTLQ
ncbi:MAG: hypothetical protein D8M57_06555 [Candidatus Scalindua sp. AMX11]|nr:MAG: hypothetical protein DWQ00_13840 [Candidatus Scalindua sp.]TDE65743.1 MAG: hypothetical protein D8M57_06555 [Candidatus Scalindua sp. AMX11]